MASTPWSGRAWGIFSLFPAVAVAAAFFSAAWAQENIIETSHKGVVLIAVPPDPTVDYDVTIVDPRQAMESIIEGLDLLLERSSRSADALETLKKAGDVVIIYHPAFPFKAASSLGTELAAFFPYFFSEPSNSGGQKDFPVVIGRYIIKWGKEEIALTLAHELLGHGIQHLQDRLETTRDLDLECEARLLEEEVRQRLGVNKRSELSVRFRQDLEWRYCVPFKQYMAKSVPDEMALWKTLNPNVPALLAIFETYLATTAAR